MSKHKLKALIVLTALIMAICSFPLSANAASSYSSVKAVKSGSSIDLNKDGKKDKITYTIKNQKYPSNSKLTLKVNKASYTLKTQYTIDKVYYGDVSSKDKYIELFVLVLEECGSARYYIFRYNGKKIVKSSSTLSCIYDYGVSDYKANQPYYCPLKLNKNGGAKVLYEDFMLKGNFYYDRYYKLASGFKFQDSTPKNTTIASDFSCKAKSSFKMYKSKSRSSGTISVSKGAKITGIKTDLNHWVQIKTSTGKTGWLYDKGHDANWNYYFLPSNLKVDKVFAFPAWG